MKTYTLIFYMQSTFSVRSDLTVQVTTDRLKAIGILAKKLEENIWWDSRGSKEEWEYVVCINGAIYYSSMQSSDFEDDAHDPGTEEDYADALRLVESAETDALQAVNKLINEYWLEEQSMKDPKPGPGRSFRPPLTNL